MSIILLNLRPYCLLDESPSAPQRVLHSLLKHADTFSRLLIKTNRLKSIRSKDKGRYSCRISCLESHCKEQVTWYNVTLDVQKVKYGSDSTKMVLEARSQINGQSNRSPRQLPSNQDYKHVSAVVGQDIVLSCPSLSKLNFVLLKCF